MNCSEFVEGPVFPIPPSYTDSGELDYSKTKAYLRYLESQGAKVIMTTAGTSQFNLMTIQEIRDFNFCCVENFRNGAVILGLPMLGEREIVKEIDYANRAFTKYKDVAVMLLYPERHYDDHSVGMFFSLMASRSKLPVFVHAQGMKKGQGGHYDYSPELIKKLADLENVVGIKEEHSSFEGGYEVCRAVKESNPEFRIIVAGKSQRRYTLLKSAGADTFLTGIGSIVPSYDRIAHRSREISLGIDEGQLKTEDRLFEIFMKIGWHPSLRYALQLRGFLGETNRRPFVVLTSKEKERIFNLMIALELL